MTTKKQKSILIIGNGKMAKEYARVYREGLGHSYTIAGRELEKATLFSEAEGALGAHLLEEMDDPKLRSFDYVVVASSEDSLETVTHRLLEAGVRRILLEKPGALCVSGSRNLADRARRLGASVRIACNRRYYRSIRKLREILDSEPAIGATFDFTEISSQIGALPRSTLTKSRWGLVNPIHVVDTLCHLLGPMSGLEATIEADGALAWHPSGAVFRGSAMCGNIPVTYLTSWLSPGRWEIQVLTRNGRYKLSPMEKLVVMRHDSRFQWLEVDADDAIDLRFKAGLHDMLQAFESWLDAGAPSDRPELCLLPDLSQNTETLRQLSKIFSYPEELQP